MLLARPASAPQLFSLPVGSADPEFSRVLRTADPGPALDGPLTFLPAPGQPDAWNDWQRTVLAAPLAPALLAAVDFAGRDCAREMRALDRELDSALDPAARARSAAAGRRLLARLSSSRGARWPDRFRQWIAADETPAHFAVVYAAQHALFHLPLRLLVPTYAYWEWSAAGGTAPDFARESAGVCQLAQTLLASPSSPYAVHHLSAVPGAR